MVRAAGWRRSVESENISIAAAIGNEEKYEMHRIPRFTAEQALEQEFVSPYAGLARSGAGGGAVEPAWTFYYECVPIQSLPSGGVHYHCSLYAIVE